LSLSLSWAKERLAVAAAEQEDKAVQVLAQLVDVIGADGRRILPAMR